MDSAMYTDIYSTCARKFTQAASNVTLQESIGNWPIKKDPTRVMLLYTWVLSTGQDPNTPLTDHQILAIKARVSNFKYA